MTNAVIAGCSHRKLDGDHTCPALDLYRGGCLPALRARVGADAALRARVFILSARHGLLAADDPIAPYDQQMTPTRARQLRPVVSQAVAEKVTGALGARDLVVLVEPVYLIALADLFATDARPRVHWFPDPALDWPLARRVIDGWGW
jgi:hypothetical protein